MTSEEHDTAFEALKACSGTTRLNAECKCGADLQGHANKFA